MFSFIEYVKSKLTQTQFDTLFSFALLTVGFAISVVGLIFWASGSKNIIIIVSRIIEIVCLFFL